MKSWGFTLILFAVLSVVLPYIGLQLIFMIWVDHWGLTIGWVIRGVLAAIGIGLVVAGSRAHARSSEQPDAERR